MLARLIPTSPPAVAWFCEVRSARGARLSRVALDDLAAGRSAAHWLHARGVRRVVVVPPILATTGLGGKARDAKPTTVGRVTASSSRPP